MRLDFEPEPLALLRERYPAALEPVYDQVAIVRDGALTPAELRAHVFDFEDGLRLMVSRERTPEHQVVLHLSASVEETTELYQRIKASEVRLNDFCYDVIRRWRELSGSTAGTIFLGLSSPKGCPHWHVVEGVWKQSKSRSKTAR